MRKDLQGMRRRSKEVESSIDNLINYIEKHGALTKSGKSKLEKLESEKEVLSGDLQKLEFEIERQKNYQIDSGLLIRTLRDFGGIYNELSPEEQSQLLHLMLQEVTLSEDSIKLSLYPLSDSGKSLEYLLERPEFSESDKKRD